MVDPMNITPALSDAVSRALDLTGYTWEEVARRGGPSSTTMTGIVKGEVKPISVATCRKLDAAFDWPLGTARSLVDPGYQPPQAVEAPEGFTRVARTLTEEQRAEIDKRLEQIRQEMHELRAFIHGQLD
jgi:DNA-binding XRE family transcriptional regulator